MTKINKRLMLFVLGAGLALIGVVFVLGVDTETATGTEITLDAHIQEFTPQEGSGSDKEVTGDNSYCLLCHSKADRTLSLPDGELDLHVVGEDLANSVHGVDSSEGALGCVDCHGARSYPHETITPASEREYSLNMAQQICTECHTEQTEKLGDGVHADGLARGNLRSATCTDCHGAHDVQSADAELALASQTCGECHSIIYAEYAESVHGKSVIEDGDPNVPNCTTCHGVHGIDHPTTALARNRSPELCAECHADKDLMDEYEISTNVFDSYLADFHGTTTALFDQGASEVATNKAVCYDCHGVHNITPADDSKSQVAKENLLVTCQQCHPNATTDFPDSWVGHFEPTAESNPFLFGVDWFYKILIPMVLGGFVVMVVADAFGRMRMRVTGTGHGSTSDEGGDDGDAE